ncbi:hypothetical protein Halxa_2913 [Halopiger xanaduensis SH-6]|uniref:Uncharacterized protein n=1 Tax=Halopiger xanaduensis (strain DSM 18323 / JCM 14033 / SH-6) TaxID=797210 RepID=F8D4R0_HALXS|nr:hypothetical protein Halxa_2913 [Halopiger xanaduensis SH-6]
MRGHENQVCSVREVGHHSIRVSGCVIVKRIQRRYIARRVAEVAEIFCHTSICVNTC